MKIKRTSVLKALERVLFPNSNKTIIQKNAIDNIQIFDNEVCLDITIDTPTFHVKKKIETDIIEAIHDQISNKIVVKLNVNVLAKSNVASNVIKGNKIDGVANIIAIASGKGGVGKSTITANLSICLAKMGFKVGVVDADIYGPSMHIMFGVEKQKPTLIKIGNKNYIKPVEAYGVKLLSIGFFAESNQAVVWRGPMASKALSQLLIESFWSELDFLLIDLPPGTGDIHLSLVQTVPVTGVVVVSTPQDIALADARKAVSMFKMPSINVPILGIIENMSFFIPDDNPQKKYYIFGKEGAKNLAKTMKIPFIGEIPVVQSIRESSDKGSPLVLKEKGEMLFKESTQNLVKQLTLRNKTLSESEIVKITTMAGCVSK